MPWSDRLFRVALAATPAATGAAGGATQSEVEAAFQDIQCAVEACDLALLERLVHPDSAMLHALGQIEPRTSWFALVGRHAATRSGPEGAWWTAARTPAGATN